MNHFSRLQVIDNTSSYHSIHSKHISVENTNRMHPPPLDRSRLTRFGIQVYGGVYEKRRQSGPGLHACMHACVGQKILSQSIRILTVHAHMCCVNIEKDVDEWCDAIVERRQEEGNWEVKRTMKISKVGLVTYSLRLAN
ncbi:unnamed protein product [Heterobilharzia americana]|nr:unnamed protein product [Heterobilharzia americana]